MHGLEKIDLSEWKLLAKKNGARVSELLQEKQRSGLHSRQTESDTSESGTALPWRPGLVPANMDTRRMTNSGFYTITIQMLAMTMVSIFSVQGYTLP